MSTAPGDLLWTIALCVSLSKEVPIDVVIKISKHVIIKSVILVHVSQIVLHAADKVCEQHLVVDEHSIVEEVVDEHLQVFPVVEVVNFLLQVALQQLVKLVRPDRLHGFVEEAHGLAVGTVKDPGASFRVELVGVLTFIFVNFTS